MPPEWEALVNDWLKKMGYRFVLRRFTYPEKVKSNSKLDFESWWENKGVAPCYQRFPLAIRFTNKNGSTDFVTAADIRTWLPGDNLYNDAIFIPKDMKSGDYDVQIALLNPLTNKPKVLLAIEGKDKEGWYTLGKITVE